MEKLETDHITTNITRLIACTRNYKDLCHHLIQHKFISKSSLETIRNTEHDTDSRVRELYLLCKKTPDYQLLIRTLKESDNPDAASILEELYPTAAFGTELPNTNTDSDDFEVSALGSLKIKAILEHHTDLEDQWADVMPLALNLTGKSQGELKCLKGKTFGVLILNTLNIWRKEKVREAKFKVFLKFLHDFNGNPTAEAELVKNMAKIRSA